MTRNRKGEIFKATKEGKYIKQFGTLLIISAVLMLGFMVLVFLATISNPDLASPFLFFQIIVSSASSAYLLSVGPKIRRYEYSPQELKNKTVNIILVTIASIITGLGAFLGGFIEIESIMLLKNWNKKYAQAYGSNSNASNIDQEKTTSKKVVATQPYKKEEEREDEYEDDMI